MEGGEGRGGEEIEGREEREEEGVREERGARSWFMVMMKGCHVHIKLMVFL